METTVVGHHIGLAAGRTSEYRKALGQVVALEMDMATAGSHPAALGPLGGQNLGGHVYYESSRKTALDVGRAYPGDLADGTLDGVKIETIEVFLQKRRYGIHQGRAGHILEITNYAHHPHRETHGREKCPQR